MFIHILAFLILLLPLTSCGEQEKPLEGKPLVLVSVPPYIYFVDRIAAGAVEVASLIPAGVSPHIYEATPREVQRHQSAALWIYLGESFDKRTLDFFKKSRKPIEIFPVTQGIDLLSYCKEEGRTCPHHAHEEGKDLHIWLSPRLAKKQAEGIAIALGELLPAQKQQFGANLKNFLRELDELDAEIAALLAPMQGKAILVSHPAFAYFCRDYDLVQLSIEMEGKDPLPQHVTQILAKAKQLPRPKRAHRAPVQQQRGELIAQSLGLPTHLVDPYAENYSENLLEIAKVIAE